jgi:hypothetical protein
MHSGQGDLVLCGFRSTSTWVRLGIGVAVLFAGISLVSSAEAKPFMDYIKPMPPVAPLSDATWGDPGVIPRDISNGIESTKGKGVHP